MKITNNYWASPILSRALKVDCVVEKKFLSSDMFARFITIVNSLISLGNTSSTHEKIRKKNYEESSGYWRPVVTTITHLKISRPCKWMR